MDRTDIHGYDRNTYFVALALYKVEFEEIWCPEIINIIGRKPKTLDGHNMAAIQIPSDEITNAP